MNLVFTLDSNYVYPLKVLLFSVFETNKNEKITVYILHTELTLSELAELERLCHAYGHVLQAIDCSEQLKGQNDWTVSRYYSIEMYYWLLAPFILPEEVDRALYLDPDIIALRSIGEWYHQPFEGFLYQAASHNYLTKWLKPFNAIRLQTYDSPGYFNAGVVLMNVKDIRKESSIQDIFDAVEENKHKLILPDQDIFNLVYSGKIKEVDWRIYNLPPVVFEMMETLLPDEYNGEWVKEHPVFIHYMGKSKPWKDRESYMFHLGKYYYEKEQSAREKFPDLFQDLSGYRKLEEGRS